jgi:hypothetical protein
LLPATTWAPAGISAVHEVSGGSAGAAGVLRAAARAGGAVSPAGSARRAAQAGSAATTQERSNVLAGALHRRIGAP